MAPWFNLQHLSSFSYTDKLSCFRPDSSTVIPRSIADALAFRHSVTCYVITSSI
jgi:hypothetical protein